MVKTDSPNRRRSVAVSNQNRPVVPKGRRRAHSIVPGDRLSPLAKARRSLVPRKSILKASINFLNTTENKADSQSAQPVNSQNTTCDNDDITESMDITQDMRVNIHDNTSRKSFGRRVSFAEIASVRFFEKRNQNRKSTGPLQSLPAEGSLEDDKRITNENDYPASSSRNRRRSSVRFSMAGSEDMDLTTVGPTLLVASQETGSAIDDGEPGSQESDDDMDVTNVIRGELVRKRSLSLNDRQPLSQVHASATRQGDDSISEDDQTRSSIADDSFAHSENSDISQTMDFTIPLNQSLRPAHEDHAWLALRQATHSGHTPIEPQLSSEDDHYTENGMELADAVKRLMRARDSLTMGQAMQGEDSLEEDDFYASQQIQPHDDSFTSTESSFEGDGDNGDRTMNVSKVLGRASLGDPSLARMSIGYQDSTMDESEIYGTIIPPTQSTPRPSLAAQISLEPMPTMPSPVQNITPKSSVFHPPDIATSIVPSSLPTQQVNRNVTFPIPFSFTPKAPKSPSKTGSISTSASPSKIKARPTTFSAAFAPPVTRPSPKKSTIPAVSSPNKRPRPADDEGHDADLNASKPSPAKRPALSDRWLSPATASDLVPTSLESQKNDVMVTASKPKPLPLSKKAPFQAQIADQTSRSSGLRRPSGYFARRKSLAVVIPTTTVDAAEEPPESSNSSMALKKKSNMFKGRASLSSGPPDAWKRFDKNVKAPEVPKETLRDDKPEESSIMAAPEVSVDISSTRALSAPSSRTSSSVKSPVSVRSPSPSSPSQTVDVSENNHGEDLEATEQWRDRVDQEPVLEDDSPVISIEQFFSMTGIRFMDELSAPRRSIHQPSRQPRNATDIPLAEYVNAVGIDLPQLILYSRVSRDLQAWMEKSKTAYNQAEEEAAAVTPELFVEYSQADEEGQADMLHQLNLIKTNTRGLARSDWYDWKLQWVEGLRVTAEQAFTELEEDARALEMMKRMADEVVPSLEKEYEDIVAELEKEQFEVAEIEASNQDYLNELKATIAEQNIEVETLRAEVAESNEQLRWLEDRLAEIDSQKGETSEAIAKAQRLLRIHENSTRTEVFKLKDELEALEDLHMFRATKVSQDVFEYIYASQFHVVIPCKNSIPITSKVHIKHLDKARAKHKDDFPSLTVFLLDIAKQLIVEGDQDLSVRQIVHRLADYWSSCTQLRLQLKLLSIKYPVTIHIPPAQEDIMPNFKATAMVIYPTIKSKALISFVFTAETFCEWPLSIGSLHCEVEVGYGSIDRTSILKSVADRLSQATPADNYGCLLDACLEAQDMYH